MTKHDTFEREMFEGEVEAMLRRRAADVDTSHLELTSVEDIEPMYAEPTVTPSKSRHKTFAFAAAMLVVAGAAGTVALRTVDVTTGAADEPAPIGAIGDEVQLVVIDQAPQHVGEPALVLRVDDRITVEAGSFIPPDDEDASTSLADADTTGWQCIYGTSDVNGVVAGACGDLDGDPLLGWSMGSEDPADQGVHMLSWGNVPPDAALVTVTVGDLQQWQRPVDGMAFFPLDAGHVGSYAVLRALAANGTILAEVSTSNE